MTFLQHIKQQSNVMASTWEDVLKDVSRNKTTAVNTRVKRCKCYNSRYALDGEYSGKYLTSRQRLILMDFLLKMSAREIADKHKLSERTIEDYSKILRAKFSCTTKRDLIQKLNALNYLSKLRHMRGC